MAVQTLSLERINTPTGRVVIVTADEHCLRAVDWEDHEPRIQRLLRRHYGTNAILIPKKAGLSSGSPALMGRKAEAALQKLMDEWRRSPPTWPF